MTRHCQGSECTKISSILERNEAEGNDDKQDSFLVNVPTEQERRITAECGCSNKGMPARAEEEFGERNGLEKKCQSEAHACRHLGKDGKRRIAHQSSGHAVQCFLLDRQSKSRSRCIHVSPLSHLDDSSAEVLTKDQDTVHKGIYCPYVGGPIRMTQTTREWE